MLLIKLKQTSETVTGEKILFTFHEQQVPPLLGILNEIRQTSKKKKKKKKVKEKLGNMQ